MLHQGDLAVGRACFDQGRAIYARQGIRAGLVAFLASAGLATLGHGVVDEAEQYVADARAEFDATGQGWTEPILLLAEAELARARPDAPADVATRFSRAEALARGQGASAVAARIAEAAARCSDDLGGGP